MRFKEKKAIYLQIADYVQENILAGQFPADQRMPSVRDLAVSVQVNPNTVTRTYNYLQENGIIYTKRGVGYFVAKDGYEKTLALKRKVFLQETLPEVFKMMKLLKIDFSEFEEQYHETMKSE